jgi:hypothetical protein
LPPPSSSSGLSTVSSRPKLEIVHRDIVMCAPCSPDAPPPQRGLRRGEPKAVAARPGAEVGGAAEEASCDDGDDDHDGDDGGDGGDNDGGDNDGAGGGVAGRGLAWLVAETVKAGAEAEVEAQKQALVSGRRGAAAEEDSDLEEVRGPLAGCGGCERRACRVTACARACECPRSPQVGDGDDEPAPRLSWGRRAWPLATLFAPVLLGSALHRRAAAAAAVPAVAANAAAAAAAPTNTAPANAAPANVASADNSADRAAAGSAAASARAAAAVAVEPRLSPFRRARNAAARITPSLSFEIRDPAPTSGNGSAGSGSAGGGTEASGTATAGTPAAATAAARPFRRLSFGARFLAAVNGR